MFIYETTENFLKDKTILITGAGDGIGKAIAECYANFGANIILLGKTVSKLEKVYDSLIRLGKQEHTIIPWDLKGASEQNYQDMNDAISHSYGALDGLVLNAGIISALMPFESIDMKAFDDMMQVNLRANVLLIKSLLPTLSKAQNASIICNSSSVGRKGRAFWGGYAISKFALEGLMQVVADEYSHTSIRCNCVNPGAVRTAMRAKVYPGEDPNSLKNPSEIMPIYCYLMSNDSLHVNNKSINAQERCFL